MAADVCVVDVLVLVREALFNELVKPGDTGFWGVGVGDNEVILYYDESRAVRRVNPPSIYVVGGEAVRIKIVKAPMPKAIKNRYR